MTFSSLGLSDSILEAIASEGYTQPTPIQQQAIPFIMKGRDVMGAAKTGTGKTASFTLPIIERLLKGPRATSNQIHSLILAPTRELAMQIAESVSSYSRHTDLRSVVVFGGVKINPQMMKLRKGADILIATPGRLLDLYSQNAVKFKYLKILVLDEADRMLDMGFIHDIRKVLAVLPPKRQNLMFSATFSKDIRNLAQGMVNNPAEISLNPGNTTVESVKHWLCPVDAKKKSDLLFNMMIDYSWKKTLVFTRTKHRANQLAKYLNAAGIITDAIHGNKSQNARVKALAKFKSGEVKVLVATDVAARGIDIELLPQVVNFDLPNVAEDYVHRIGRTGRAGAKGEAISLVSADEVQQLSDIERLIKQVIRREEIDGFEPTHAVPLTRLNARPTRASTAKNNLSSRNKQRTRTTTKTSSPKQSGRRSQRQERTTSQRSSDSRPHSGRRTQRRSETESQGHSRHATRPDSRPQSGRRTQRRSEAESQGHSRHATRPDSRPQSGRRTQRRSEAESQGHSRHAIRSDSRSHGGRRTQRRSETESQGNSRHAIRSDSRSHSGRRTQRRCDTASQSNSKRAHQSTRSGASSGQSRRRYQ